MTKRRRSGAAKQRLRVPETRAVASFARPLPWLLGTGVAFCACVALDRLVLHNNVLTTFNGQQPLSPLYAFWMPQVRMAAASFVLSAIALVWLAPKLLESRTSDRWFAVALLAAALALPLALFATRESVDRIGMQFLIYRGEEYFDDALKISDLSMFLRHYTELVPQLSLHGRVHPPGFAAILYLVRQAAGPSPYAAGVVVLLLFSAGVLAMWRAFARVLDRRQARIAALLGLAIPSLLDFACTSMDAVFFSASCLVLWASFAALGGEGRWWHATVAGVLLYLAALLSFSAVPLGLFVSLYALGSWWRQRDARIPAQLILILAGFGVAYLVFRTATGFDLWSGLLAAREQHYQIMSRVIGQSVASAYLPTTFGNISALLIGSGLAVVPLFLRRAGDALKTAPANPLLIATAVVVTVVCAGGLYVMETERILMFVMPWLTLTAVAASHLPDATVRLLLTAGWFQTFVMEVLLFTLW
ncbi:MAG: glycosyltransferase family 39 protein [Acidobacteriota bacterium]